MKKTYMLVYSSDLGDREKAKSILNGLHMIEKWRYDLPNCFYLVSEYSAMEIAKEIRSRSNENGRFIISEIPSNSYGWLSDGSWHLIQYQEYKPK